MLRLLHFVPKNHLSRLVGKLVHLRLPPPLGPLSVRIFADAYKIDLASASKRIGEYRSIGELFVRDLKEGARPIAPDGVRSPVDGKLRGCGPIEKGEIPQIKGKSYTVAGLLRDPQLAEIYTAGSYFNFYLAPPDYHHIHAPVSGRISAVRHIPGKLWPVNDWSIRNIDGLFTVNERVSVRIDTPVGPFTVVMVGATNVGEISLSFDPGFEMTRIERHKAYDPELAVEAGARIGTFHMGSSVVLLCPPGAIAASSLGAAEPRVVRYGARVAELTS